MAPNAFSGLSRREAWVAMLRLEFGAIRAERSEWAELALVEHDGIVLLVCETDEAMFRVSRGDMWTERRISGEDLAGQDAALAFRHACRSAAQAVAPRLKVRPS